MPIRVANLKLDPKVNRVQTTERCTVAVPPKCGSNWMLVALPAASIDPLNDHHAVSCGFKPGVVVHEPGRVERLPAIVVVRDPVEWYESVYPLVHADHQEHARNPSSFRKHRLKGTPAAALSELDGSSFQAFVEDVLDKLPGFASQMFEAYATHADHVVALGDLDGMVKAFRACDLAFDEHKLRSVPPQNVSDMKPTWPAGLRDRVAAQETFAVPGC